jgi:conjugal transfer ATP-binding protein TraC
MEQGISLNPFSNIPVNEYTENFLDYAKRTVALMASPSGNITDLERSIIEACLNRTWKKHKQNTTITLLCEELKREGSIESANLARMLYPYTKDGNFGKFFEAKAEVNFTNPLTVIEFEEIADREDLLAVVMQIVSIQIVQMFSGDRQTPFILIVDEAWRTMEKFAPLLERFVRTFRKYGGSLIIVTQAYSDFLKSSSSKTIWDNSQWRLFLSHDSDSVRTIRSTEHFEEPFLKLLETVRMSRGQYSEVLITSSQETVVGRLMLDKYSQALYSTNAEDYNKISGLMKSGLSIVEAIEKVAV